VIGSGTVTFRVAGNEVGHLEAGSSFGEQALLYSSPRAATAVARTKCGLFRLDQGTFRGLFQKLMKESHAKVLATLRKVLLFKDLDESYLNKISYNLKVFKYHDGEVLVKQGDPRRLFVIQEGKVDIDVGEGSSVKLGGADYKLVAKTIEAGKCFGEYAIMEDKWGFKTATAVGDVEALSIDREQFMKVLGGDLQGLIKKSLDKKKLMHVRFGARKGPTENQLDLLVRNIKERKFPKGHVFFTEGKQASPALYLIRKGKVSVRSAHHPNLESVLGFNLPAKESRTIDCHGYFGNDTLGANEQGSFGIPMYTCVALEDIEAGVLDMDAIRLVAPAKSQKKGGMSLEDLDLVRILGAGTFGKVWLVSEKATKDTYALKIQVKKQLIEYNQAEGVIHEKNIMAQLDHPFIVSLVSHWKDEDKLYMVLKMYQGGELQSVIHTDRRDGIPEWGAKFYAANVLEGLSYMHNRHIIYRDLKPENVMLDSNGHAVIIDLGFAKIIKDKTYTFCGTPLYLAPEIVMQKGHDKGADHWSWGVMLYEMIVGDTPFYDGVVDQMGLFKNIVKCRFEFPEGDFMSLAAKDLITRMLTVNQNDRLGSFNNAEKDIQAHPFFEDINWEDFNANKVPFKPRISDPLDGSNFDDYSKMEAKVKKEMFVKLTAAEQKMFDKF